VLAVKFESGWPLVIKYALLEESTPVLNKPAKMIPAVAAGAAAAASASTKIVAFM
jgi:hypothetical protein